MTTGTQSKVKKMSPQFLVTDIEHSIEFYTKKLGFSLEFFMKISMLVLSKMVAPFILKPESLLSKRETTKGKTMILTSSFQ